MKKRKKAVAPVVNEVNKAVKYKSELSVKLENQYREKIGVHRYKRTKLLPDGTVDVSYGGGAE